MEFSRLIVQYQSTLNSTYNYKEQRFCTECHVLFLQFFMLLVWYSVRVGKAVLSSQLIIENNSAFSLNHC